MPKNGVISVLSALVGLLVVTVPTVAVSSWSPPVMVYDGNYSESALAVDAHGDAHIAARGDSGIWYLTNESGHWTRTRLTTDHLQNGNLVRAFHPAITIERSSGKIVVAYQSSIADACVPECPPDIDFVTNTGNGWSRARLVPNFYPGGDLSIAAWHGDIAIAALGPEWPIGPKTQVLEFAHKADGWALHRVAGGGDVYSDIGSPSLALDSAGRPRIAFQRNGNLKYAVGATRSGDFSIEKVAAESGEAIPSLALTAHDRPMIVWAASDGTHYARRYAGRWQSSVVMPGQADARLTLDSHGAHVVTADGANGLWYGTGTTIANWTSQRIADASVNVLSGIGIARNGRVKIAYQVGDDSPRIWFTHSTN